MFDRVYVDIVQVQLEILGISNGVFPESRLPDAALAAFATDLESLPHVSRLSSAALEASGAGSWFATFTVDFVKEKTPAAASSTALTL